MHTDARQILEQQSAAGGGARVILARQGQPTISLSAGEARPGVPMSDETILLWLSAGKPVTAAAIALLYERGRVSLDAPVCAVIPEFARNGKHVITIRHLLTHTAGLHKVLPSAWELADNWDGTIARICAASLPEGFTPAEDAAYDPSAAWFVLGEIIQRRTDEPFEVFVKREIFARCETGTACFSYPAGRVPEQLAQYHSNMRGSLRPLPWNAEPATLMPRPGASLRATAADLVRFYQSLLDGELLQPDTVRLFTSSARGVKPDRTFGVPMDWGLGFMVKGAENVPYSFGGKVSAATFGHGGQQSSIAFADPETQTVVVAGYTTLPGEPAHNKRMRALLSAIIS